MKSFTERNPVIIGAIVIVVIALGTGAALLLNGGFFKDRYTVNAIFTDTAGLRSGDKVRVAGVLSGTVGSIEQRGGQVQVELLVDQKIELSADTRAEIVVETLLGSKYVRLDTGDDWSRTLADGAVIRDTETPTEVLDLQNVGTPLLEDTDAEAIDDLLGKLDTISEGQRGNVEEIVVGLNRLTGAINARQDEARRLIDSSKTVTGTLAARDEDLLQAVDDINVVLEGLSRRRVELAQLLARTESSARATADLVVENRPQIDAILTELHADLAIIDRRQGDLAASLSGLSNAISGFASVGYSGPDEYPNSWANMYAQLIGPIGPDAVFGSCGLLDDAFDVLLGPDPITECADRTGPLPNAEGGGGGATTASTPTGTGGGSSDPLGTLYGPLTGAGG